MLYSLLAFVFASQSHASCAFFLALTSCLASFPNPRPAFCHLQYSSVNHIANDGKLGEGLGMRLLHNLKCQEYLRILCSDLGLKQTFQLDQPPLCYKVVPTWYPQSVSSFSSNDFTRWSPFMPEKMPNSSKQSAFLYLSGILIWYCHLRPEVCSRAYVLLEY